MLTINPSHSTIRMGSSMPQRQYMHQPQAAPQISTPTQDQYSRNKQGVPQVLANGMRQLQALEKEKNTTTILNTTTRVLSNSATALRSSSKSPEVQQQASLLEKQAQHERLLSNALANSKWKTNGQQNLNSVNAQALKLMILDLAHPSPEIAESATSHLTALGLTESQIQTLTKKIKDDVKKNTKLTFTGKSLDELLNESVEAIQANNSSTQVCEALASHGTDTAKAMISGLHFSGLGLMDPEGDYWYEMLKIQERKDRCTAMDESVKQAREHRDMIWKMRSENKVVDSQQQLADSNQNLANSQQHLADTIQQKSTLVPASLPNHTLDIKEAGSQELMAALNKVSLGHGYSVPPLSPNQYTTIQIPSEVQFDRTWFNHLPIQDKKAIFLQQWNDLPENFKSDLIAHPEHFQDYFPNFSDTINSMNEHLGNQFISGMNSHLHADISHFSDYFTSWMDALPF